ncbi:hypothetical protein BH09ACT12_BH09ACT12_24940 [soil metagenome]
MAAHLRLVSHDEVASAPPAPASLRVQVGGVARILGSMVVPVPRAMGHLAERALLAVLPPPSLAEVQSLPVVVDGSAERLRLVR